ncbi:MAG: DNA recombination protein RmuC [Xanthomonadales bacterium]|nr:DNA recombination protein RmuC [Xanthomonadales bacterium]
MNAWFSQLDPSSLLIGLLAGLLLGVVAMLVARARAAAAAQARMQPELDRLEAELREREQALSDTRRDLAVLQARLEEQQKHFQAEKAGLEEAEKRLTESFERLAGKVFDERSKRFTELSEKQLGGILKPLTKDLEQFRNRVDETHREDIRQQAALRERLKHLEGLNERLNEEARNLTRALTTDVKAQGSWGEQQLEKLLELSGMVKGENYHTQYSVTGQGGERLQPDLVLMLPENRTIVMDSKVSLTAWTRMQSAENTDERDAQLAAHVQSLRTHIDRLSAKNYSGVEELNALDFVLMFVPIEGALIAALRADPSLPEYALKKKVALLSPANFLATVRTVASVWMIHKQNTNAQDIAARAGLLYDKFVGFTDNLRQLGQRLDQARKAWDDAYSQLSTGAGNLVGQTEKLRVLGAKHTKQLEAGLVEKALESDSGDDDKGLRLVKPEDE